MLASELALAESTVHLLEGRPVCGYYCVEWPALDHHVCGSLDRRSLDRHRPGYLRDYQRAVRAAMSDAERDQERELTRLRMRRLRASREAA
jgi:hypothetical protein